MESIRGLIPFVREAGELAAERQSSVLRSFKADGSVLTQVDRDTDRFLRDSIISLFPDATVISEEQAVPQASSAADAQSEFTFTVDPIDGTDCFSQGMPGWAVAVGLLDRSHRPIAGIVYAPKWGPDRSDGAFFFADIGERALLNDAELPPVEERFSGAPQIFAGSSIHKGYHMESFPGKVRNAGSTVIHIVAPLMHRSVVGTIFRPNYIWDIAAAHAIVQSHGLVMEYFDGRPIDYSRLIGRERAEATVVAGTASGVRMIRRHFQTL